MWVQKTKPGHYQYFENYVDPVSHKRRVVSVTLKGHTKADQKAARLQLAEKLRNLSPGDDLTLQGLTERYIAYKYANLKKQTAYSSELKLGRICRRLGPNTRVSDLKASYVWQKFTEDDKSKLNMRLAQFKAMMRWGYRNDLVKDISFLDKIQPNRENARVKLAEKFLEADEVRTLLDAMDVPLYHDLTEFLILSGMRIGEVIALTVDDVDFDRREININKTYAKLTGEITSTKTEASERVLYMQDELLECAERIRKNFSYRDIFIPYYKDLIHYDTYRKYLRETSVRAIGRKITPHALRHTNVALLAANGISLEAISRRVGHQDSQITRQVYFHVTEKLREKENAAVKEVRLI